MPKYVHGLLFDIVNMLAVVSPCMHTVLPNCASLKDKKMLLSANPLIGILSLHKRNVAPELK